MIRPQLRNMPGVTEVNTIGGYERQIHITPDPARLLAYGFTLRRRGRGAVATTTRTSAPATSSATAQQFLVRVPGPGRRPRRDSRDIVLDRRDGVPIRVRDVAEVGEGRELRTGAATQNGQEVVLGTVFMLIGENSRDVAQRRGRASWRRSRQACPPGVARSGLRPHRAGRPHDRARCARTWSKARCW